MGFDQKTVLKGYGTIKMTDEKHTKDDIDAEKYTQDDVDAWVIENDEHDASGLFNEKLPGYSKKLDRLDSRIRKLLSEIQDVFPDAEYYTAGGGFNLVLGSTHEGIEGEEQQQRSAWWGLAVIGDGDW